MANVKISGRAVKFIHSDKVFTTVTFKVGNCKIDENDLDTLIELRDFCKDHPANVIDCRIPE